MGVVKNVDSIPSIVVGLLVLLYFDYRIALAAALLLIPHGLRTAAYHRRKTGLAWSSAHDR